MRRPYGPAIVAALLLGVLAFGNLGSLGHDHDALLPATGHADLPVFAADHVRPDPTEHVESAALVETSPCTACIHRQRKSTTAVLAPSPFSVLPCDPATPQVEARIAVGDGYCSAAPRAPPQA